MAYPIRYLDQVDEGNFLTHAIMENRVTGISWTHHLPGGRQADVGTVMYMTDITVQPRRLLFGLQGRQGIPFNYDVAEYSQWCGLQAGEFLDLDWDFFAAKNYPRNSIKARVEAFFDMDFKFVPAQIYVCYSPRYSHPSRDQFEMFVDRLNCLFRAKIVRLPNPPSMPKKSRSWVGNQWRRIQYQTTFWLRQRNIY